MKKQIKLSIFTLIFVIVLTLIGGSIGFTKAADTDVYNVSLNVTYQQTSARSMLDMVNSFRTGSDAWYYDESNNKVTNLGLSNLTYDYSLEKVAMQRAVEIAKYYSHYRPDGSLCFSAYEENGVTCYTKGENIAAGYTTVSSVFTAWQETNENYDGQGHRRNMLSGDYNAIGIACVKYNGVYYWVQEFADLSNLNTTKTTANDSTVKGNIEIAEANISDISVSLDSSDLIVPYGESIDIPTITTKLLTKEEYPQSAREIIGEYTYTVDDTSIIELSDNKINGLKVGTTTLTISILNKEYNINVSVKKSIKNSTITLEKSTYKYTGSEIKPSVKVTLDDEVLDASNYTVTYSDNDKVGTAYVTVTGIGNYTDSVNTTFEIYCEHTSTELKNVKSATYDEEGYTGDTVCTICGTVLEKGETIAKLENEETSNTENNNSNSENNSSTGNNNSSSENNEEQSETEDSSSTEEKDSTPKTGELYDSSETNKAHYILPLVGIVALVSALGIVIIRKNK